MDYVKSVSDFMKSENIELIAGTGETSEFSSRNCDICNGLPGQRESVKAYKTGDIGNNETCYDLEVCFGCLYASEYGENIE